MAGNPHRQSLKSEGQIMDPFNWNKWVGRYLIVLIVGLPVALITGFIVLGVRSVNADESAARVKVAEAKVAEEQAITQRQKAAAEAAAHAPCLDSITQIGCNALPLKCDSPQHELIVNHAVVECRCRRPAAEEQKP